MKLHSARLELFFVRIQYDTILCIIALDTHFEIKLSLNIHAMNYKSSRTSTFTLKHNFAIKSVGIYELVSPNMIPEISTESTVQ
jgi:hypothetical protein